MKKNKDSGVKDKVVKSSKMYLIMLFFFFSLSIILTGYFIFNNYSMGIQKNIEDELTSVSNLKVEEIVHWRNERTRNLLLYQKNESFRDMISKIIKDPSDPATKKMIADWMTAFQKNYGYYRVCLHDMNGVELLSTIDDDASLPHNLKSYFDRLFVKEEVVFEDFFREKIDKKVYLSLLVGIFDIKNKNQPLGVLIARVDPESYLYPMLNRWPVPRETTESFLLKRIGDDVVFVNKCKHNIHTALEFKFNIEKTKDLPTTKAVTGYTGIYKGIDFENEHVISYMQPIPDSPWFLVTQIDRKEALKPIKGILVIVISAVLLLLLVLSTGIFFILRNQSYNYYKEIAKKAKELQQSEENLRKLNESLEVTVKERTHDLSVVNDELKDELRRKIKSEEEKDRLRHELQHSQKMQAIGTLAAGIAHEINSPLQFTNDNVDFISNSVDEIMKLVNTYNRLLMTCHTDEDKVNAKIQIAELVKKINFDFISHEMPEALSQTKDGISRIRKIVNAMKNYSNFNNEEKKPANINETLENAELITRNEWKYHAEVENEFAPDMQYLNCYEPELNQVFMNLLVNAAHTTKDAVDQKIIKRGKITVRTSTRNNNILISINDNGLGIPKEYQERVYDPFFTTKEVGKGTGQGLSIAHKIVVERHGGKIWFETELNKGTTFYLEVPI
jgi:signal transduction histidine kinase